MQNTIVQGLRSRLSFLKPLVWLVVPKPAPEASLAVYLDRLEHLDDGAALTLAREQADVAHKHNLTLTAAQQGKLGVAFLRGGALADAKTWLNKAVQSEPGVREGLAEPLAAMALKRRDDPTGEKLAQDLGWTKAGARTHVIGARYYFRVAQHWFAENALTPALNALERAAELDPAIMPHAGHPFYDLCFAQKDPSSALAAFEARFPPPRPGQPTDTPHMDKESYFSFARRFISLGQVETGLVHFDTSIAIDRGMLERVAHELAMTVLNDEDPTALYRTITAHYSDSEGAPIPGKGLPASFEAAVARFMLDTKKLAPALDAFSRTVRLDAGAGQEFNSLLHRKLVDDELNAGELLLLARRFGREGSPIVNDVWVEAARAAARNPDASPEALALALRGIGHGSLLSLGNDALSKADHKLAIAAYNEAIKKKPQDILTRLQIGVTHYLANEHVEAEAHFAVLRTLQAAERQRYGVEDKAGAILHSTWTMAIGHIACLDTYVKAQQLGWIKNQRSIVPFDPRHPPAGMSVLARFSPYLDVVAVPGDPGPVLDQMVLGPREDGLDPHHRDLRRTAMMEFFWALPNKEGRMRYYAAIGSDVQAAWAASGRGPLLSVSEEENTLFRTTMEQAFGLPRDAWYVVLHVREAGFKTDWEAHHKYTRNARIEDYRLCVEHIVKAGGWVVRAGDPSMRPIPPMDKVIDYATSPLRSPELDVLLCAKAKFFLGTNSGFSLVPPLFGTRCVLTNWSPLANPNWYPQDIFVPKLVLERATNRPLTFAEMYASLAGWSQFERDFQGEWQVVDNTPEQLRDAVIEMLDELDRGARPTAEDDRLQAAFNAVVLEHGGYLGSRMGAKFLRENRHLLGKAGGAPTALSRTAS